MKTETKQIGACPAEPKRVLSSRGNAAVDLAISDVKMRETSVGSDDESNASADTYTIDSDGKEELQQERARIDVAFGIVSDSTSDDRHEPATDNSGTHLLNAEVDDDDEDINDSSLQIHEDSDEPDQPCLKRTKNQTLFQKYTIEDSASSGKSDTPLDFNGSVNVNHNPNDTYELAVVDRDISVTVDQEAHQTEWTSSQSSVKRLQSETDDVSVHDKLDIALARQNISDAAGGNNTVAVATECNEPMLVKNSKADASFGDDDDDDGSQPAAVSLLKATDNNHEVERK